MEKTAEERAKEDAEALANKQREQNGEEFEDGEEGQGDPNDKTKVVSEEQKKKNSEFAKERRAKEAAEKERVHKEEVETARVQGIIDGVDGINPFTNEPMKNKADVEEYLTMRDIKKAGGDPLKDFAKKVKEKQAQKEAQEKKAKEIEESTSKEVKEFGEKHPDIDLSKLLADEDFKDFSYGKFGEFTILEIYEKYLKHINKFDAKAAEKAAKALANGKANPGTVQGATKGADEFYTEDEINKMNFKQVRENIEKVNKSLAHIREKK